ncbi:hypothetical protein MKEN_00756700 [Mycena kentingensis (nom. inval.)]|nr:hypothetical protein MKEN_00756700 [Mycena kentingensis (nom. inval.)]
MAHSPTRNLKRPRLTSSATQRRPAKAKRFNQSDFETLTNGDGRSLGVLALRDADPSHGNSFLNWDAGPGGGATDRRDTVFLDPFEAYKGLREDTGFQPFVGEIHKIACANGAQYYLSGLAAACDPNVRAECLSEDALSHFGQPEKGSDAIAICLSFDTIRQLRDPRSVALPALVKAWKRSTLPSSRFTSLAGLKVDPELQKDEFKFLRVILQTCYAKGVRVVFGVSFAKDLLRLYIGEKIEKPLATRVLDWFRSLAGLLNEFNSQDVVDVLSIAPCRGLDFLVHENANIFTQVPIDLSSQYDVLKGFFITDEQRDALVEKYAPSRRGDGPSSGDMLKIDAKLAAEGFCRTQLVSDPGSIVRKNLYTLDQFVLILGELSNSDIVPAETRLQDPDWQQVSSAALRLLVALVAIDETAKGIFESLIAEEGLAFHDFGPNTVVDLDNGLSSADLSNIKNFLHPTGTAESTVDLELVLRLMTTLGLVDTYHPWTNESHTIEIVNNATLSTLSAIPIPAGPGCRTIQDAVNTIGKDSRVGEFFQQIVDNRSKKFEDVQGRNEEKFVEYIEETLMGHFELSFEPGVPKPAAELAVWDAVEKGGPPRVPMPHYVLNLRIDLFHAGDMRARMHNRDSAKFNVLAEAKLAEIDAMAAGSLGEHLTQEEREEFHRLLGRKNWRKLVMNSYKAICTNDVPDKNKILEKLDEHKMIPWDREYSRQASEVTMEEMMVMVWALPEGASEKTDKVPYRKPLLYYIFESFDQLFFRYLGPLREGFCVDCRIDIDDHKDIAARGQEIVCVGLYEFGGYPIAVEFEGSDMNKTERVFHRLNEVDERIYGQVRSPPRRFKVA